MNHNFTQPSDDGHASSDSSPVRKCKPQDELNQTPSYNFESLNSPYGITSLIPEPEEIPTEALKMDHTGDSSLFRDKIGDNPGIAQGLGAEDQEKLLNNTFSGVDVSMVRTLLGAQSKSKDESRACIPDETDMSITIECAVPGGCINSPEIIENTDGTDEVMIETIQYHGNISNAMENSAPYHETELETMRNPADYSKDSDATMHSESHDTTARNAFFDTGKHVFDCYIENDSSVIHNQDYNSALEGSVLICSTADEVRGSQPKNGDGPEEKRTRSFLKSFRRTDLKQRIFHESLKRLIGEHPLISEDDLYERLKCTDQFTIIKMNKKRFAKVLNRLRLSSSYERFRYFVKA
jgi:hypothetical protein